MCIDVLLEYIPVCMYICMRVSGILELELQTAVSHHVGAGN